MNTHNINELVTLLIIIGIVALCYYRPKWKPTGTAHGTSAWSTIRELLAAGMLSGNGLILGRTLSGGKVIRLPTYCHTSVYAPTGAGKGVSFVIPTLLSYTKGAVFVWDPKGENHLLTAKARAAMGQRIMRIDPFQKFGTGDCYNPLDAIRDSVTLVDDALALAESMVVRPKEGDKDPFWNNSAVSLLTAMIVFTLMFMEEEDRNLSTVRDLICDPAKFEAAISILCDAGGIPARLGNQLKRQAATEKEAAGVISTASTHTAFLDSKLVGETLSKSTFSLDVFLKPNTTVYLILPVDQLDAQRNFLRLLVSSFMRYILRHGNESHSEVLYLLDECSSLSNLEALSQALVLGRGSGIRLFMLWQTYEQAKAAFKDKPNLVGDNSDCQIFLGTNGFETAERESKMLGASTITVTSGTENGSETWSSGPNNNGTQSNRSWGTAYSEKGRDLLQPAEILTLSPELMVCFIRGLRPLLCRRIKWFRERALFGLANSTPLMWWVLIAACVALFAWSLFGR
jgi:type IV secretion system protein VirD4